MEKIEKISPEGKSRKEQLPEMETIFYYSPHWTEEDARLLKKNLEKVDVFCPEMYGYEVENVEALNRLAQGDHPLLIKYLSSRADAWTKIICQAVFDSKKIIWPIDIKKSKLAEDFDATYEMNKTALRQFGMGELEKAMETRRAYIKSQVEAQKKREEIILENFKKLPEEICAEHSELKRKKKLRVLVTLGAFHTFVYHEAKKAGYSAEEVLATKPYIFSRAIEALRKERFSGESHFSDEFIAKSFIEDFLTIYFEKFSLDIAKNDAAARIVASQVDFDLIKKISASMETRPRPDSDKLAYVADFLRKNSIEVPKNKEEFEKLVEDYQKKKFGK